MNTTTENTKIGRKGKAFLYVGTGLIAVIWVSVFALLAILQPTLKTKAMILALGAGSTELIVYAGVIWFGVNIFKSLTARFRRD